MRGLSLLLMSAAVAACAPTAAPMERSPQARAHLDRLLAGRVAGPPQNCINRATANNMITIDDNTVVFKVGNTYYRNDFNGFGCPQLGTSFYTLVTKSYSGSQLCRSEIATVVDPHNGTVVGSCTFGDFVPYRRS